MSKKPVTYDLDIANLPPLSDRQRAELDALDRRPAAIADPADPPELGDAFWRHARQGAFYRPTKTSTTLRIDSDVLAWLRSYGKGYQSRINAILRREMLQALK